MSEGGGAFGAALLAHAARTEALLERLLSPSAADAPTAGEARVWDAMRYGALGAGKRLRAFLALESGALYGAPDAGALRAAAAVECVHAYSLIHDDLPSMDDDAVRRGRPTTHLAYDEATAILAGDALQALAFEILAGAETSPDPAARLRLVTALAGASGAAGMVGGQMIDILAEGRPAPPPGDAAAEEITRLQALKTGALFEFSCVAGPLLTGADAGPMRRYAAAFGLAFQIRDDLLDVLGDEAEAGKKLRKDAEAGKATFVDLLGAEGAERRAEELVALAEDAIAGFGAGADGLRAAVRFAVTRRK